MSHSFGTTEQKPFLLFFVHVSELKMAETAPTPSGAFTIVTKRKATKRKVTDGDPAESGEMQVETIEERPAFPPVKREKLTDGSEMRKIAVPAHRYSPLKENWMKLFTPIVERLGLQIRFNLKNRQVEIRSCKDTQDISKFLFRYLSMFVALV